MNLSPKLSILKSLLFTYCIENYEDHERESFIVSKNVNDDKELSELFDSLTKPEYLSYGPEERQWHIDTLQYFLGTDESFESVFYLFDTYFDDEIIDKRQFMRVLLECLSRYQIEVMESDI
ncbi:hypothetical protein GIW50_09935 [Pseudomonas syringae]|uniref:Uncharacterized protein n=1 Tax=Pseudomonas syringae TaxID=317 RepID=A0A9Q3X7N8_PSESX|nr:hypothetical protein [Pseudomonas syringae]MCF5065689.1 hypothetical protein [Pseudomonas syringae]MCF5075889.1 hypothetical protein [Pseudomonas syringae]MCF5118718.1 hypothetical protein [Pseudomonas syringae]MCF5381636.1 hypothetical protein [Pseudomonas syringae]